MGDTIPKGTCIDIYSPTTDECQDITNVQIVDTVNFCEFTYKNLYEGILTGTQMNQRATPLELIPVWTTFQKTWKAEAHCTTFKQFNQWTGVFPFQKSQFV